MIKNKKGFSLIELLGVIVIMGVIALIAVPMVTANNRKVNETYYENLTYLVKIAGQDYFYDYRSLLPIENGGKTTVNLSTLVQQKYIDPVVSVKKNPCEGTVEVSKKTGYEYKVCLKCDDYQNDKSCGSSSEGGGGSVVPPNQYLTVSPTSFVIPRGQAFVPPYASFYSDGALVRSDVGATPSQVDTNVLKTYTLTYYYKNVAPVTVSVKIIDVTPPGAVTVTMRKGSSSGAVYTSGWTNTDIYQTFQATDDVGGSGIQGYEYSFTNNPSNSSLWTLTLGTTINQQDLLNKLGSSSKDIQKTVYVRAVDNFGNRGPVTSYSLAIDKTLPSCTSSGGNSTWRNTDLTLTGTCADGFSGCSGNVSKTYSSDINSTSQGPGNVSDKAGNTVSCPANQTVRIDKTAPSASVSVSGTTVIVTASDSWSGLHATPYSYDGGVTWESSNSKYYSVNATVTVKVRDQAGNIYTSNPVYITVYSTLASVANVGDYVAYDAGIWGYTNAGGWVGWDNNHYGVPVHTMGGFYQGTSRNEGKNCAYGSNANYGWRIWSKSGNTVTLISAGTPMCFNHPAEGGSGGSASTIANFYYQQFVNGSYATSATWLNKGRMDERIGYTWLGTTIYDSLVHVGAFYWLGDYYDERCIWEVDNYGSFSSTNISRDRAFGIRVMVTLKDGLLTTGYGAGGWQILPK